MRYLIYGAYGYTGTLIAERAVEQGHEPLLAGRDEGRLRALARSLDREARAVALDQPGRLRAVLDAVPAVLHCAGPFSATSAPMVAACLDTGTHYLDITGEIPVFQALQGHNASAEEAGVVLLPGVGFDVVPTDCLAASLAERGASATSLEIAFVGAGPVSKGTLKTAVEQLGDGGRVRREGRVVAVPPGWASRRVPFRDRTRTVVSIPWGDVVTAGHSTGIPNVTVYTVLPDLVRRLLPLAAPLQGVFSWSPVQTLLKRAVDRWGPEPTAADRARGWTRVWAAVRTEDGARRTAHLHGPEAYTLTARAAVGAVERVVDAPPDPGFQTPSTALGASFVSDLDGVEVEFDARTD
jgi:saccharopine dehydrogenase (NAD+, L-lysine-forming)